MRPKDHIEILRPLLPERYAPLQANGNGLQSVYLTELPLALAEVLIGLIGDEVIPISAAGREVKPVVTDDLDAWERRLERSVADDVSIPETDRLAIVRARKGQGIFKDRVSRIESRCRITGVDNPVHLTASHGAMRRMKNGSMGKTDCSSPRVSTISSIAGSSASKTIACSSSRQLRITRRCDGWASTHPHP